MNRLSLKIKNKTKYKISSNIKGELTNILKVFVYNIDEYSETGSIPEGTKAIVAFCNAEKSVANVIEKYLKKSIAVECIANDAIKDDDPAYVNLYLDGCLIQKDIDLIIDSIFTMSILIANSKALYLDDTLYSGAKRKPKKGQDERSLDEDGYVHILRQPLDAVVLPRTINESLADLKEDKRELLTLGRNSKVILVNLDNLHFEECIAFVEEEKTIEKTVNDNETETVKEYGVYREDGTWCKRAAGESLECDKISVSPYITRKLCNKGNIALDNLLILRVEGIEIQSIGVANIDKVLGSHVQISRQILDVIKDEFPSKTDYCLIHEQSGSRMVIDNDGLEEKVLASRSKVCLNYYQRVLMGLQPSSQVIQSLLHTEFYSKQQNGDNLDELIASTIEKCSDDEYLKQNELKSILNKGGFQKIRIFPEFNTYGKLRSKERWTKRLWIKYASKTVGAKSIQLRCARPYNVDEISRIVRLSSDKIAILGIEPTDVVTLRYKDNTAKARVLPYDINNDWKEIRLTNLVGNEDDKAEVEAMVGIPAAIRDELGIPDVNVAVSVERNAEYVFHKNRNVQFLPIVALIISVFDLCSSFGSSLPILLQLLIAASIVLVLTPFVFYIMLSGERAKVKSNDKDNL